MNILLDLHPKQWNLIVSPSQKQLLIAIAHLASHVELVVLDCGRQFDSSIVARAARGRQDIIDRIRIQRAFTCYETVKLLERISAKKTPIVILDFLSTFYDENIRINSRTFLVEKSLQHFQRLSHGAGLAVSIHPPPGSVDAVSLFERMLSAAPQISAYETAGNISSQLSLFPWET
jgi:hypothetical protein